MQRKDVNAASYGVDVGQLPKLDELKWDED
jgi:hypothetical protein